MAGTETTLPSSATQGFVPANTFVYDKLDCGVHDFGAGPPQDYLVGSGTLQFHGTETDVNGTQTSATLNLMPSS